MKIDDFTIYGDIRKHLEMIRKYEEQKNEIDMITTALQKQMIAKIKKVVRPFSKNMLYNAFMQQDKPAKERQMYKFVEGEMKERFFDGYKAKLERITSRGNIGWAYLFQFKVEGKVIEIQVPVIELVDEDNVWQMSYGEYVVRYPVSTCKWDTLISSYKEEECAAKIAEWIESKRDPQT